MISILITYGISLLFIVLVGVVTYRRMGAAEVIAMAFIAIVVGCLMMPMLFVQGFVTLVLALLCRLVKAKPVFYVASAMLAAVAAFVLVMLPTLEELRMLEQIRAEHPFESVTGRLSYEETRVDSPPHTSEPLRAEIEQRLGAFEDRPTRGWGRRRALQMVHDDGYRQFVAAQGFGNVRMMRVRKDHVELPKLEAIPLPNPAPFFYEMDRKGSFVPLTQRNVHSDQLPSNEQLLGLHSNGAGDFLDMEMFGYVKDREHVSGFKSHQFAEMPTISTEEKEAWQVVRLELVSLLRFDKPKVYVSDKLPKMDELQDATTRPLNAFEKRALEKLWHDEDLVIDDGTNRIGMLGSLRAGKDCLECHQVNRGELLGAFSYDLFRKTPVKQTEPATEPPTT